MPGKVDEKKWQRAKEIVTEQKGHAPKGKDYGLVQHIYGGMKKEEESNAEMAEATTTNIERKAKRLKMLMDQATEDSPPWVVGKLSQAKTHVQDVMDYVGTDGVKKAEDHEACIDCSKKMPEDPMTNPESDEWMLLKKPEGGFAVRCPDCHDKKHGIKKSALDRLKKFEPLQKIGFGLPIIHKGKPHDIVGRKGDKYVLRPHKEDSAPTIEVHEDELFGGKKSAEPAEPAKCECGAHVLGYKDKGPAHSHWCPMHEMKKSAYWGGLDKAMKDWADMKGVHKPVTGKEAQGVSEVGEKMRELHGMKQEAKGKFIEPAEYMKMKQLKQKIAIRLEETRNQQRGMKPVGGTETGKPKAESYGVKPATPEARQSVSRIQSKWSKLKEKM